MTIARTKEQINLLSQSYTKELNNIEVSCQNDLPLVS